MTPAPLRTPRRHQVAIAMLSLLAFATAATPAHAGNYPVYACDAAPGWVNNSWVATQTHGGMAIYQECPSGGFDTGLVTRHVGQASGSTVPTGAAARWWFTAPPGAAVVGVRMNARFEQFNHRWQVGLSNGATLIDGCWATPSNTGGTCGSYPTELEYIPVPPSQDIYTETYCAYGPCPAYWTSGTPGNVFARAIISSITVTVSDGTLPGVSITGGGAAAGGWRAGVQSVSLDTADNSGVKWVRVLVGDREAARQDRHCDFTQRAPCTNGPATLEFNTAGFADGRHTLSVQSTDAADNTGGDSRELLIDNTPPGQPIELALAGGDGWRSENKFRVTWTNPKEDHAPIAAAEYEICRASDGAGCVRGERTGKGIEAIEDIKLPEAGVWTLRLWLRDEAGNADPARAGQPLTLRLDQVAPDLAFREQAADDPARLRVNAVDATSGIASGAIEMRRQGEQSWRPLATDVVPGGLTAVVDDEALADGTYELRARAADAAGNERSTDKRESGDPAHLTLPVRVKTRLAVGKPKRIKARRSRRGKRRTRTVLLVRPQARFGRTVRLTGRLTMPGANPLAGVPVEVFERVALPGAEFNRIATVSTSRTGRFVFKALRGPSRTLRFRYPGTPTIRSRTTEVDLRVRAATTIRASRRFAVTGEYVTFRGRLKAGPVPAEGKLVELQVWARERWRTFATTRARAGDGRWSYRYRFDSTRGKITYRFRARIRRETAYPYHAGKSRRVRVTVQGL